MGALLDLRDKQLIRPTPPPVNAGLVSGIYTEPKTTQTLHLAVAIKGTQVDRQVGTENAHFMHALQRRTQVRISRRA